MSEAGQRLGVLSALSIGIGGMVGGGIFATTGLAVELTRGSVSVAFLAGGLVALLTSYSYWKLTLRYPSAGGTVVFLHRGFGAGTLTGAAAILLCFSYVVLIAVYAYAFGAYAASFFAPAEHPFWRGVFLCLVIVGSAALNVVSSGLVIRSENFFNAAKLVLLALFVVVGLAVPMEWQRLEPQEWVRPVAVLSGAMIVFFNYEGFELIANAAPEIEDPERTLPIAYVGGVLLVIAFYLLISMVVVGHLPFGEVPPVSSYALSAVAERLMGSAGHLVIAAAALLATTSAINATLYGSAGLTYSIAKSGQLPAELTRNIRGRPLEGMLIFAALALLLGLFVPLHAIATMGSAGFLLIFMAVNAVNVRLARETRSSALLSALGALSCGVALFVLCLEVGEHPGTRWQLEILAAMITAAFGIEIVYRAATRRTPPAA